MCLFEPTPELWPHIKATWEANGLTCPRESFCGFVGDTQQYYLGGVECWSNRFPDEAYASELLLNTKFSHMDEDERKTPRTTIDAFSEFVKMIPRAITIDVEGWELAVLKGAEKTLREHRPLVWVSLHEGFVSRPGVDPKNIDVHDFMASCGYEHRHLGVDHESHEMYIPR